MPENKVYYFKSTCEISGMSYIGKQFRTTCVERQLICWVNEKQVLLELFFSSNWLWGDCSWIQKSTSSFVENKSHSLIPAFRKNSIWPGVDTLSMNMDCANSMTKERDGPTWSNGGAAGHNQHGALFPAALLTFPFQTMWWPQSKQLSPTSRNTDRVGPEDASESWELYCNNFGIPCKREGGIVSTKPHHNNKGHLPFRNLCYPFC